MCLDCLDTGYMLDFIIFMSYAYLIYILVIFAKSLFIQNLPRDFRVTHLKISKGELLAGTPPIKILVYAMNEKKKNVFKFLYDKLDWS